jgi:hypothetical protein
MADKSVKTSVIPMVAASADQWDDGSVGQWAEKMADWSDFPTADSWAYLQAAH